MVKIPPPRRAKIEIKLPRNIYAKDTIKALYAFTDCEVSLNTNLTLIRGNLPETGTVDEVIRFNTEKLVADLTRELEIDLARLSQKLHARLLEQIFIENRVYKLPSGEMLADTFRDAWRRYRDLGMDIALAASMLDHGIDAVSRVAIVGAVITSAATCVGFFWMARVRRGLVSAEG